jgi:hypothetical protein
MMEQAKTHYLPYPGAAGAPYPGAGAGVPYPGAGAGAPYPGDAPVFALEPAPLGAPYPPAGGDDF